MLSGVCGRTSAPSFTQCCTPSLTYSRRRKCQTSVVVPTVRLAPAARQPLLDRDRRRNAVDRVHLRPSRRLHDAARIGVERFEVAPLAFVEQDVEGQRRLARAGHARHHAELVVRDVDRERLEVVLAGVDDLDGVDPFGASCALAPERAQARSRHVSDPTPKRAVVFAQRLRRVRARMQLHLLRRALGHQPGRRRRRLRGPGRSASRRRGSRRGCAR